MPSLPQPTPEAAAHSARLAGVIRTEIENQGPMRFDRFMSLSLYAPGLGYYSTGRARFGAEGDFVTAPALSPMFGRCVARQCAQVLAHTGGDVFELGAGDGALAVQVLEELAALDSLPERYVIFEPSAGLHERQRRRIELDCPAQAHRVTWLEQPPQESFTGVVLANEVVDALPVRRFRRGKQGTQELCVRTEDRGFAWSRQPADAEFADVVERLRAEAGADWPDGYQSEHLPGLAEWLYSVTHALSEGVAFLVDYGYPRHEYYHPERSDGTLICHYRHLAHDDPFLFIGLQDITAFVDFTALAEAADRAELEVAGYSTQGAFLLSLGLANMLQEDAGDGAAQAQQVADAKRLIMPGDMGDRFKVMALKRGSNLPELDGFQQMDLREQLLPAR